MDYLIFMKLKKIFDQNLSISHFSINWISQASADQRSGRAGRTGPGFCYRLYSTPVYANIFKKFSDPEILNTPIESVILQLKAIGIKNILRFPFPTIPNLNHIKDAIISLVKLKALETQGEEDEYVFETIAKNIAINKDETTLTELGKILVYIPLHPRYAKMLLKARTGDCLGYMLLIVCALSVDQLCKSQNFAAETENNDKKQYEQIDKEDDEKDAFKSQIDMMKEQKAINEKKKKEFFKQVKEFKQRYSKFMNGKSDLFFMMNLLGNFIECMNSEKVF